MDWLIILLIILMILFSHSILRIFLFYFIWWLIWSCKFFRKVNLRIIIIVWYLIKLFVILFILFPIFFLQLLFYFLTIILTFFSKSIIKWFFINYNRFIINFHSQIWVLSYQIVITLLIITVNSYSKHYFHLTFFKFIWESSWNNMNLNIITFSTRNSLTYKSFF